MSKEVGSFKKEFFKFIGTLAMFILSVILFFWVIFWAFSDDDAETKAPKTTDQLVVTSKEQVKEVEKEPIKQEENSAYTNCMSQTEYLKWADKERLTKSCEKLKWEDASLTKNQEYAKKNKWDIVIGCRTVIKKWLKQPDSADFKELWLWVNYKEITYKTEVTSKNDFNAEVHNIVMCTLDIKDWKPGTINAKLEQ